MSEIKEKIVKDIMNINGTITNETERVKVLDSINNIIDTFTLELMNLANRQDEMEEKTDEIFSMLSQIEEELIQSFGEDLESECPYCGEIIPLVFPDKDSTEFECPKCHNTIELELMLDGCNCDCEECEHSEHPCNCQECEEDEEK